MPDLTIKPTPRDPITGKPYDPNVNVQYIQPSRLMRGFAVILLFTLIIGVPIGTLYLILQLTYR
jgi:hypothetical protein